jgi:CheY-like chemotaxis protein
MPGINGREAFERIRDIHPRTKVLYISGYTDGVISRRGVIDDNVALLTKPFDAEQLAAAVRDILGTD